MENESRAAELERAEDVAQFTELMVSTVGELERRIARQEERIHVLECTATVQQHEIEKMNELNQLAFAKVADSLGELALRIATPHGSKGAN